MQGFNMLANGIQIITILFWLYTKFDSTNRKIDLSKVALVSYGIISGLILSICFKYHLPIFKQIIVITIEALLIYLINKKLDSKE